MRAEQIKQREEENPNDIHEVPIKTRYLDRRVILGSEAPPPGHQNQDADYPNPNYHVQRVDSGHSEIEPVEHLHVCRVALPFPVELLKPRNQIMRPLVVVLVSFHSQERKAEKLSESQ